MTRKGGLIKPSLLGKSFKGGIHSGMQAGKSGLVVSVLFRYPWKAVHPECVCRYPHPRKNQR